MEYDVKAMMYVVALFACCAPTALFAQQTLEQYAKSHPLVIQTVGQQAGLGLEASDQTNNLASGNKVLALSNKGLTSIEGIAKLRVRDGGRDMAFSEVSNVHLFLSNNKLMSLPPEFFDLEGVRWVYLHHNQLDAIPPQFARMKHLLGMYFTGNNISAIPPEVFTMSQLRKLQVSKNHLTELPSEIGKLTELRHLNLANNEIPAVPASIGNLHKLRVCDLSGNKIFSLPEEFGKVKIVHQLRVSDNPLTGLPTGFVNMPGTIDITGTKIDPATLPPAIRAKLSRDKPPGKEKPRKTVRD